MEAVVGCSFLVDNERKECVLTERVAMDLLHSHFIFHFFNGSLESSENASLDFNKW